MQYKRIADRLIITDLEPYAGKPVAAFLTDYKQSAKKQRLLIKSKELLRNGERVASLEVIIKPDDVLTLMIKDGDIDWPMSEREGNVVYENAFVYIVRKPPGMIIHDDRDKTACLNALAARYQFNHDIKAPVRPLHRLDRDTQGFVIFNKIPFFQPWFDDQLAKKKVQRRYLAVCRGSCPLQKEFTFTGRIGRNRHRAGAFRLSPSGKPALTEAVCLAVKEPYVLFRCELGTGRTHQIRVHLSAAGFPIVNDPLYGLPDKNFTDMGLCAYEVVFCDPISLKKHRITDKNFSARAFFTL